MVCNRTAPVPNFPPFRQWKLDPLWRRVCETRNFRKRYVEERNWCWVGIKEQCHANLKAHHAWVNYHDMAARGGKAPPIADETFRPLANPAVCDRPQYGQARAWTEEENTTAVQWFQEQVAVYVLNL